MSAEAITKVCLFGSVFFSTARSGLLSAFLISSLGLIAPNAANAAQIDPRRIASCYLAAENLRERVKPETDSYAQYNEQVSLWSDTLTKFVPEKNQREGLLAEGRGVLSQALAKQDYMSGMIMVSNVLSQCNADRARLDGATPNG